MSYVCTKALRISGVDYAPGDAIPDGAIRPERVRALKTSGFIGELTEEVAPPADKKSGYRAGNNPGKGRRWQRNGGITCAFRSCESI